MIKRQLNKMKYGIQYLLNKEQAFKNTDEFYKAAKIEDIEKMKYYLKKGADIYNFGDQLFRDSIYEEKWLTTQFLLEQDADVNINNGMLLAKAVEKEQVELVRTLIKYGADVTALNHVALKESATRGNIEIFKILASTKVDLRAEKNMALRLASENNSVEIVKFLVEKGINPNAEYGDALLRAIRHKSADVFHYLIGVVELNFHNDDPLKACIREKNLEWIEIIYDRYKDKEDAQEIILDRGNEEMVKWINAKVLSEKLKTDLPKTQKSHKKNKI